VLAEWIERRLEQVREMAAQLNDSESDVDTEELSVDDDDETDVYTASELLIAVLQLLSFLPLTSVHPVTSTLCSLFFSFFFVKCIEADVLPCQIHLHLHGFPGNAWFTSVSLLCQESIVLPFHSTQLVFRNGSIIAQTCHC